MLANGTYYGVYEDGALIAMAGTHLEAPSISIAAVGNVVTHPSHVKVNITHYANVPSLEDALDHKIN